MRYVGIDTSTKTGLVILDQQGNIVLAEEIEIKGYKDPQRMVILIDTVASRLEFGDIICIEDFAYAQGNRMALIGGIGWGVRNAIYRQGNKYTEVSTGQLKNFVGAKGNCSKEDLILPLFRLYGFEHSSDNVRDAYILAQIARALHEDVLLYEYQKGVLDKVRARKTG